MWQLEVDEYARKEGTVHGRTPGLGQGLDAAHTRAGFHTLKFSKGLGHKEVLEVTWCQASSSWRRGNG